MILWQAPHAKITGYRLFLTVEGSNPKQLRLPARLSQYTLLNLRPDTEYIATLHAEQDNALSEGATAVFTTSECLMHTQDNNPDHGALFGSGWFFHFTIYLAVNVVHP